MKGDISSAFLLFALVASITPGPNNLMLMASGANHGFLRTVPHLFGVTIGFVVMCALVGAGLTRVFDAYPLCYDVLRVVSIAYLIYLAYRIATSAPAVPQLEDPRSSEAAGGFRPAGRRPLTFLEAAAFQWVNPKAWAMALTAVTIYAPSREIEAMLVVAVVFGAVNLPSVGCWALLGQQLRPLLNDTRRIRAFNWVMALLLVSTLFGASG